LFSQFGLMIFHNITVLL